MVQELACIALHDPGEIAGADIRDPSDIARLPEHLRCAITGWRWDRDGRVLITLADKRRAVDLLGRHLGLFVDRTDFRHTITHEQALAMLVDDNGDSA